MKQYIKYSYKIIIGLLLVGIIIGGCREENDLGLELLPQDDLITVKNVVIKDAISSFTFSEDSIRTDEASKSLLGSLNDPEFGKTNAHFATQFRLQQFPDFGTNPVADSVKLIVRYKGIYGDTITPQSFRVYELESPLNVDENYTQEVDLKSMASSQLLGEIIYTPRLVMDSTETDTFQQIFSIPIDISIGERLINADSSIMVNNDLFLDYFKGLYIESEPINGEGGTLLSLDAVSSTSYLGTGLIVYYNNEENLVVL